jgi:hypothetical protein
MLIHINKPLTAENMVILYNANHVRYDLTELLSDYVQSLFCLIFDTYMGDESTSNINRLKHFKWCWDKNNSNFKEEGIIFDNLDLYEHLLNFIIRTFYVLSSKEENQYIYGSIKKLWSHILNYNQLKSPEDFDEFIKVYKMFCDGIKIK